MLSKKLTAADRCDTWDAGWETRLAGHVREVGFTSVWEYIRRFPGEPYVDLAERLAGSGGFGVAPIQVERLQVHDTPEEDLAASIRDSLARHLHHAFKAYGWRRGPYWESRAIGALASWTGMWSSRINLGVHRHRLFELGAPEDWTPADERDPYLIALVPE
jgi:hypothetical protein